MNNGGKKKEISTGKAFLEAVAILFVIILMSASCSSDSDKDKSYSSGGYWDKTYLETCEVCGKTFSYKASEYSFDADVDDVASIRKTNMCTNCYENFKFSENLKKMG